MFAKYGWKTRTFCHKKSGKSDCQTRVRQTIDELKKTARFRFVTSILNEGIWEGTQRKPFRFHFPTTLINVYGPEQGPYYKGDTWRPITGLNQARDVWFEPQSFWRAVFVGRDLACDVEFNLSVKNRKERSAEAKAEIAAEPLQSKN